MELAEMELTEMELTEMELTEMQCVCQWRLKMWWDEFSQEEDRLPERLSEDGGKQWWQT